MSTAPGIWSKADQTKPFPFPMAPRVAIWKTFLPSPQHKLSIQFLFFLCWLLAALYLTSRAVSPFRVFCAPRKSFSLTGRRSAISSDADWALASVIRGAVDESRLRELEALVATVQNTGTPGLVRDQRNFGNPAQSAVGHEVTYLHENVSKGVLEWLWDLAQASDSHLKPLNLPKEASDQCEKLSLRCLEAIEYVPGQSVAGEPSPTNALNWHHDGPTICTVIVGLSTAGRDFTGGALEVRKSPFWEGCVERITDVSRGDVVAWRGWNMHRVLPVEEGKRQVIVAEWWKGPSCLDGHKRAEDTLETVEDATSLDASPELQVLLGQILMKSGDLSRAEASFRTAIELDAQNAEAFTRLACLQGMQGQLGEAEKNFELALSFAPDNAEVHHDFGVHQAQQGNFDMAAQSFSNALRLDPNHEESYFDLGIVLAGAEHHSAAAECFSAAVCLQPDNSEAHFQLALCLIGTDNLEGAEESLRTALRIDPKHGQSHVALAELLQMKEG